MMDDEYNKRELYRLWLTDTVWWTGRRIKCWFFGHRVVYGDYRMHETAWCDRCFVEYPQETITLHNYLNRWYVWMVLRDWAWFNRLDDWLFDHKIPLPSWWEY